MQSSVITSQELKSQPTLAWPCPGLHLRITQRGLLILCSHQEVEEAMWDGNHFIHFSMDRFFLVTSLNEQGEEKEPRKETEEG